MQLNETPYHPAHGLGGLFTRALGFDVCLQKLAQARGSWNVLPQCAQRLCLSVFDPVMRRQFCFVPSLRNRALARARSLRA